MKEVNYYRRLVRLDTRRMRWAGVVCWLLRLPAALRIPGAEYALLHWQDVRAEARYALEEHRCCLWQTKTGRSSLTLIWSEREAGYDGWLAPEDRYGN